MPASIDSYLRTLASDYYLKNDSEEVKKIEASIQYLFTKLDSGLSTRLKRKFVFGSYDRDTILPRKFDSKSDVDIMVVFNHSEFERTPSTYRSWLKSLADTFYKDRYGSIVINDFPTVTVKLDHINYDLVPAKEVAVTNYGPTNLFIPGGADWIVTDPYDVKKNLIEVNTKYNYIVRPIIRILKAWNCKNGYPYDSYTLELEITKMNFAGDNVQTGLFWAVSQLDTSYGDSQFKTDKLNSLKYNFRQAEIELNANNGESAKRWLHRVLPYT